jgi:hypothetical protein
MSILRCNKCGHLEELPREASGTTRPCPRCGTPTQVHDAVLFIGKVLEKFFAMQTELKRLRSAASSGERAAPAPEPTSAPESFDLYNSAALSTDLQHGPIQDWFRRRHIRVRTNLKAVDTTGFFDEVASALGEHYGVLKEVADRIRFAQLKGFASTTIHLSKRRPEEAKLIVDFCRRLYDYSFVAKCFDVKQEKLVRLVLQSAPAIREFFDGEWLEWHVFMVMLELARRQKRRYSCARNLVITLQNDESYELDVFFLLDGDRPVCIECKSGEFRQDIDRCLTLRKRLSMSRESFIMCAAGLSPEQAQGLSSMYELTFLNEEGLPAQFERMF